MANIPNRPEYQSDLFKKGLEVRPRGTRALSMSMARSRVPMTSTLHSSR